MADTLAAYAKSMRSSQTDAEHRLWSMLRGKRLAAYKFKRQFVIAPYIADFICLEHRLIIEADGSQHNQSGSDAVRTEWLETQGFSVLRFWNSDILINTNAVLDAIYAALQTPLPPTAKRRRAPPSPARGEGQIHAPLPLREREGPARSSRVGGRGVKGPTL